MLFSYMIAPEGFEYPAPELANQVINTGGKQILRLPITGNSFLLLYSDGDINKDEFHKRVELIANNMGIPESHICLRDFINLETYDEFEETRKQVGNIFKGIFGKNNRIDFYQEGDGIRTFYSANPVDANDEYSFSFVFLHLYLICRYYSISTSSIQDPYYPSHCFGLYTQLIDAREHYQNCFSIHEVLDTGLQMLKMNSLFKFLSDNSTRLIEID